VSRFPRDIDPETLDRVLGRYDLGGAYRVAGPGGGTANLNLVVEAPRGRFFLRRRNPRYASPDRVADEHALMEHLAARGVTGPLPVATRDGRTTACDGSDVYELQRFVEGDPFEADSLDQLRSAGLALARFHEALDDFVPPVPRGLPRYDDPGAIRAGYESLLAQAAPGGQETIRQILDRVARLEAEFPDAAYDALPHCLVHGDYHPANVLFRGDRVVGVFDLDWVSRQPRARDLSDGVYYFASRRDGILDGGDIQSLTRGLRYDIPRARVFLDGYRALRPVAEAELRALPQVAAARWLFSKVAGMRKVLEPDRPAFAVRDALDPVRWLDEHGDELIEALL